MPMRPEQRQESPGSWNAMARGQHSPIISDRYSPTLGSQRRISACPLARGLLHPDGKAHQHRMTTK